MAAAPLKKVKYLKLLKKNGALSQSGTGVGPKSESLWGAQTESVSSFKVDFSRDKFRESFGIFWHFIGNSDKNDLTYGLKYETLRLMISILRQCQREIKEFPELIREDLADALARLEEGHKLSIPLSRPMTLIGKGVNELRFKDRSGICCLFFKRRRGDLFTSCFYKENTKDTEVKCRHC